MAVVKSDIPAELISTIVPLPDIYLGQKVKITIELENEPKKLSPDEKRAALLFVRKSMKPSNITLDQIRKERLAKYEVAP